MNGILFSFEDFAYFDVVLKTIHCASQIPEPFPESRYCFAFRNNPDLILEKRRSYMLPAVRGKICACNSAQSPPTRKISVEIP